MHVKIHARGRKAVHVRPQGFFVGTTVDVEQERTLAKIRSEARKRSGCNLEGCVYTGNK